MNESIECINFKPCEIEKTMNLVVRVDPRKKNKDIDSLESLLIILLLMFFLRYYFSCGYLF